MARHKSQKYGIRNRYRASKKETASLEYVYNQRFQDMKTARQPWENEWDKCEKQYEGYKTFQSTEDWQSDIYIPITTAIVEAMLSEVIDLDHAALSWQ